MSAQWVVARVGSGLRFTFSAGGSFQVLARLRRCIVHREQEPAPKRRPFLFGGARLGAGRFATLGLTQHVDGRLTPPLGSQQAWSLVP
jgi:hypothetical protein